MTAPTPFRLLMLEDNPYDAELIERHLRRSQLSFTVDVVDDEARFRAKLKDSAPDIILSDYSLPQFDGISGLRIARVLAPSTPFIFVSGSIGEERAVAALREGATDYVLKDRISRLPSAIVRALDEQRQRAERLALEEQLEQARRIESLGRVAATVAHEFNNVLMAVGPLAEVARSPAISEAQRENAFAQIKEAVARGRRLTEQILRFSKPGDPDRTRVDLADWLDRFTPELRALAGRNVDVAVSANETLPVSIDSLQIQQVLSNLVVNARDAMPLGGTIHIDAEAEGEMAVLKVEDEGLGMPAEIAERIFEPLFTTKRCGTGLGLAVAQQIITRHQGSIHVASSLEKGTTFRIVLPLAR